MGKLNWQRLKFKSDLYREPPPKDPDFIVVLCSKCGAKYSIRLATVQQIEEWGLAYKCSRCRSPKQQMTARNSRTNKAASHSDVATARKALRTSFPPKVK